MGTTAFVGCYDDASEAPISGTGKTLSNTGFGYLNHKKGVIIWSNYYTTFSDEIIGFQEMINRIKKERKPLKHYMDEPDRPDLLLLVTEMQEILNSCGSDQNKVLFVDSFAHQLRKYDVDLSYDTQRFKNIHVRLRTHTDRILLPFKRHFDLKPCYSTRCRKPHLIDVYSIKPDLADPIKRFDATKVGKMYNTMETVFDKLIIPNKKDIKKEMEENGS